MPDNSEYKIFIISGRIKRNIRSTDSLIYELKVDINGTILPVKIVAAYLPGGGGGGGNLTYRLLFGNRLKKSKETKAIRNWILEEFQRNYRKYIVPASFNGRTADSESVN